MHKQVYNYILEMMTVTFSCDRSPLGAIADSLITT